MKKIITHRNPDLDAVASVWLIKRFLPGWEKAEIDFCEPDLERLKGEVDTDPDVLYLDVGQGKLDHHQFSKITSATEIVFKFILQERKGQPLGKLEKAALEEIVPVVTEVDNARELKWPEVKEPRFDFYLSVLISGVRGIDDDDEEAIMFGLKGMDALFHKTKKRINALGELKKGIEFKSPWGKAIAVETGNESVLFEGEKKGYALVLRKDPETGGVRIYARWDKGVDLTKAYKEVKKLDSQADWFLHSSRCLLLNMASSRPMRSTKLSLKQLIDILKVKS